MRGFRAKDADRDRFVELIEAAYVDGQLNSADRDLRVGRALSAETIDELQTLTRDLQLPPGAVTTTAPGARAAGPRIPFVAEVPSDGRYRLFLEFRHGGAVHTAGFTLAAGEGYADAHGEEADHEH